MAHPQAGQYRRGACILCGSSPCKCSDRSALNFGEQLPRAIIWFAVAAQAIIDKLKG